MTVNISKPALNLREKLAELDKPSGIAGEAVLRADTTAEAREAVELSNVADSATGVDVTGTVTADGLVVDGATGEFRGSGANTTYFTGGDDSIAGRQLTLSSEASGGQNNATHRLTVPSGYGSFNASVGGAERLKINKNGDISFYDTTGSTAKFHWDAADERLGLGTSSPSGKITISSDAGVANQYINLVSTQSGSARSYSLGINSGDFRLFDLTANLERMRIDSSGNVLVGKTAASSATVGFQAGQDGFTAITRASAQPLVLNRTTTDGIIADFRKDGSTVGSIGTISSGGSQLAISNANTGLCFRDNQSAILPSSSTTLRDNALDLGNSSFRFDDIYATNGSIQTSDRNEKQDIEELSEAEQRIAVACKGLMRKFRWKDAVEEKGDDARIHFGIIAQDLQAAFEAEGLDAGKYAMFISTTWWEADRIIPAVEAVEAQDAVYEEVVIPAVLDEDGNEVEPERTEQSLISEAVEAVEAIEEQTVTDTFDTLEEAPEGATERTRMGVRYTELLAFIIGAI